MSKEARDKLEEYEVTTKDLENKLNRVRFVKKGFKLGEKVIRLPCFRGWSFFIMKLEMIV